MPFVLLLAGIVLRPSEPQPNDVVTHHRCHLEHDQEIRMFTPLLVNISIKSLEKK